MKLVKSLLLGSAAGLAAVAGAQAADLPVKKAAPVEYVRVCSTYGAGFFYVPGTDSCLRISGRLRVDSGYLEPFSRADDAIGIRVRGRVNFDHRTATPYGLLRTYIRYEIDRNSGRQFGGNGQITTNPKLQQGFIQFGGLTAGRVTSFFSNPDLPTTHMGTLRFDDAPDVDLLAYTYGFGNGFSATLSVEDALSRRDDTELNGRGGFATVINGTGTIFDGSVLANGVSGIGIPLLYGGNRVPDLVANVRYTGVWGGVQLSGAVHQIRDVAFNVGFNPLTPLLPAFADTDYGFAVGLSAYVNIPWLGAGDNAWIYGTYTDGAIAYINGGQDSPNYGAGFAVGNVLNVSVADAFVNGISGNLKTVRAWSVAGGVTHFWTPFFKSSVFGSYADFDAPGAAQVFNIATGTLGGLVDFREYRIGLNSFWLPIPGFQVGVEALYTKVDPQGRVLVPVSNLAGTTFPNAFKASSGEDIWEGRLRIQRDF